MRKNSFSRRTFIKQTAFLVVNYPIVAAAGTMSLPLTISEHEAAPVKWIHQPKGLANGGTTFGVSWPQGKVGRKSDFSAFDEKGQDYPVQSWPLAYWPDGSLKWMGHAIGTGVNQSKNLFIKPGKNKTTTSGIIISDEKDILIDTGVIKCILPKTGTTLISTIKRKESDLVKHGKLVLLLQDQPDDENSTNIKRDKLFGEITEVKIEQRGPLRAVVKICGIHKNTSANSALIPFIIRLYFYHKSDSVRILHTIIYDGDENKYFIKGLGLSFDVSLKDELHNRHIRFVNGETDGIFTESVRGLTGLRRDPGKEITEAQITGKATPSIDFFPKDVSERLRYIPAFGDYTLHQGSPGAFSIRKRTKQQFGWITSCTGNRASGTVYLGTPDGGLVAGIRNFWQSYPAQIDIRNATEDSGSITLWLWAPDSPAMDLRFYHDGLGQDTFEKQREGLEITYEDYEPGFGTPKGIARTSELRLWAVDKTPSAEELVEMAKVVQTPPTLICDNKYLEKLKAFGGNWKVQNLSNPSKVKISEQLAYYFDYYKKQVEQHNWYGFWNYGDFMHTYDKDRHTWRYDVGGFAWDNSELSTDLWLWYYFLHTGRSDVFDIAEAMTRHTGEVDVHHLGPFAPLGSRHNVLHWGCSAKQLRISTAANRRFYYYLTADERVGDLLNEQIDAAKAVAKIQPGRKLQDAKSTESLSENKVHVSFGTDWGAIAAAWLTGWERTGDPLLKKKLVNSMATLARQPKGFFTGGSVLDLSTGEFSIAANPQISVSHLNAVFGLAEICSELCLLLGQEEFNRAWLQYCRLYNGSEEEQQKELGEALKKLNLRQGHSRLTAFAANYTKNGQLAKRAWQEFYEAKAGINPEKRNLRKVEVNEAMNELEEDTTISTNAVAQFGLAAIQCLAYVEEYL